MNCIFGLRVRLDTAENWKLKTEKHCSKIIFKCVNSIVGPIFNEKVVKKWNLWVREQYTGPTGDWKSVEKSSFSAKEKKKKKKKGMQKRKRVWEAQNALPKPTLTSNTFTLFWTRLTLISFLTYSIFQSKNLCCQLLI